MHLRRMYRETALLSGAMISIVCGGCSGSGSDLPPLLPVSGSVALNEAPLPGARVQFLPAEGRSSVGVTDEQGHFTLMYDANVPGAVRGPHKVMISVAEAVPGKTDDEGQPLFQEKIPPQYNTNSDLNVDVNEDHATFEFKLKSATTPGR